MIDSSTTREVVPAPRIVLGFAAIGFLVAMWLATRPNFGVTGDAQFYMIQALNRLDPQRWSHDLYFRFGTQDAFTAFSWIYRYPIAWFGPERGHLITSLAGQGLWLTALFALTAAVFASARDRLVVMAGVILLSGWAGNEAVSLGEALVTPRLFAQAAVMAAMACGLRGRIFGMCGLVVAAAAIQPTISTCGVGIPLVYLALRDRRLWVVIGALAAAGLLATSLHIGPLAPLWRRYDPTWWAIVQARFPFALLGGWPALAWVRTAAILAPIPLAALSAPEQRERRLLWAVGIVTVASLALSVVAAELGRNVLLTGLQLWRSLWVAALAANAAIPILLLRSPRFTLPHFVLAAGAAGSFASRFLLTFGAVGPPLVLVGCLLLAAARRPGPRRDQIVRVLSLASLGVGLFFTIAALNFQMAQDTRLAAHLASLLVASASAAGLALCLREEAGRRFWPAAAALILVATIIWDQRVSWTRFVYGNAPEASLDRFMNGAGRTWWEGDTGVALLWFKLRRPSYYSCIQGTEGIFFRDVAMEWARRRKAILPLDSTDASDCRFGGGRQAPDDTPPTPAQVRAACDALPDLDTIVLERRAPGLPGRAWTAPAQVTSGHAGRYVMVATFWRYDCGPLRRVRTADAQRTPETSQP